VTSAKALDAAGHRTAETTSDAAAVVTRQLTRVYDQLGRLEQQLDAQNHATAFAYDANGNQTSIEDALDVETHQTYDPLNRLKTTIQDYAGLDVETSYTYDALDRLVTVTDPKGLTTDYTYDGLGNLTELDSPDTGVTTYTHDAAGNRLSQTDARGITATYAYDALNRLTGISYPTPSLNVAFQYDQSKHITGCIDSFPKGRLTGMRDASGGTTYCYDRRGNPTSKRWQAGANLVFTTSYTYTRGDRLAAMTDPNGLAIHYTRDAAGRIVSLSRPNPNLQPIVTDVDYLPFGPASTIAFAGGATQTFVFDQNYWSEGVVGTALTLDFDLDATGNITAAHHPSPGYLRAVTPTTRSRG
jgi:YD repeat-containing protein